MENGKREMMMAGGKRCNGTSGNFEQVLMYCLHKESHSGKPWAKVSGKVCQMLGYEGHMNLLISTVMLHHIHVPLVMHGQTYTPIYTQFV